MSVISLQDIYFVTMLFAALISLTGAALFYQAYRKESALQAPWRAIGFGALSVAFLCAIIQLRWPFVYELQLLLEAFGFIAIYRGMTVDPYVSYLQKASSIEYDKAVEEGIYRNKQTNWVRRGLSQFSQVQDPDTNAFAILTLTFLASIVLYIMNLSAWVHNLSLVFFSLSLIYIVRTIVLQTHRLITEKSGKKVGIYNILPLAAYVFFATRFLILIFLSPLFTPLLSTLLLDSNSLPGMSLSATFAGLLCIALWLWPFIHSRTSVRAHIVILLLALLATAFYYTTL